MLIQRCGVSKLSPTEYAGGGDVVVGGCFPLGDGASAVPWRENAERSQMRQRD